jgi:hypothetical protein
LIASFYKSLKPQEGARKIPASVISELNRDLPQGYTFIYDEERGQLIVKGSSGTKEKMEVEINLEEEGIPKDIPSDRVMDYIFRTQKTIHLRNARIEKKGKTLFLRDFDIDPITGKGKSERSNIVLVPQAFPEAAPMQIETSDGIKKDILFKRQPYASLDASLFSNVSFPALKMEWIVPDKKYKNDSNGKKSETPATVKISVNVKLAKCVDEAIAALKIFRDYINGTLILQGKKIGKNIEQEIGLDINKINELISYWSDIKKLEDILGVSFNPQEELHDNNKQICLELLTMFVQGNDVVYKEPFSHFHIGKMGNGDVELKEEDLLGKENVCFSFTNGPEHYKIYGVDIELHEAIVMLGLKVDQIVKDKNGMELYISSPKNEDWKLIRRFCLSSEDAQKAQQEMCNRYRMPLSVTNDKKDSSEEHVL